MVYAEFQKMSTGWNGTDYSGPKEPIPALGSDGVMLMDGRWGPERRIIEARKRAEQLNAGINKGIVGFRFMTGRSYSDSRPLDGKLHWIGQ